MKRVALDLSVSTSKQDTDNQPAGIRGRAQRDPVGRRQVYREAG